MKNSKYGVFSGPYFPVFGLNTEIYTVFSSNIAKYGPEKTSYLDTFHALFYKGRYQVHNFLDNYRSGGGGIFTPFILERFGE